MTHSFPTRRSSDRRSGQLAVAGIPGRQVRYMDEARWDGADIEPLLLDPVARVGELVEHVGDGRSLGGRRQGRRSEEHTSELKSLMRSSYAVFCLKKKNTHQQSKKQIYV